MNILSLMTKRTGKLMHFGREKAGSGAAYRSPDSSAAVAEAFKACEKKLRPTGVWEIDYEELKRQLRG